jgi:hypothetical protein
MGVGSGGRCGFLEVIQELGQPPRISQKEPSQHRLKSRGLPIQGPVTSPGTGAGPVAAAPDLLALLRRQPGIQPLQGPGLGLSLHLRHHGVMQIGGTSGLPAMAQPLMQIPDGITEPGELERSKIGLRRLGRQGGQPQGGGLRPR